MSGAKGAFGKACGATKPKKKKTDPRITLRLTEEEHAKLTHAAAGMTLSAYVRKQLFGKGVSLRKVRTRAPVKDHVELARVLGMLGQSNVAKNVRELADAARIGILPVDDTTAAAIHEAVDHIRDMRAALMKGLGVIEKSDN